MARPKSRAAEILSSNEEFLGTKEAAAIMGLSVSTIHKMVEAGTLRAWRTQGGHRRIAAADIRAINPGGKRRTSAAPHQPLSILIVEDNPTMVKAYTRATAKWGDAVNVTFAQEAASALLQIARKLPNLVITDLAMEPFDGFHLIRALRASPELADTRVLVVTGLSDAEIEEKGGLDALTLCYHKPLSFERFSGYVDARIQDRQHPL